MIKFVYFIKVLAPYIEKSLFKNLICLKKVNLWLVLTYKLTDLTLASLSSDYWYKVQKNIKKL